MRLLPSLQQLRSEYNVLHARSNTVQPGKRLAGLRQEVSRMQRKQGKRHPCPARLREIDRENPA
jgi:hypothetical protein